MNTRPFRSWCWMRSIGLALLLPVPASFADAIRVTAWNLPAPAVASPQATPPRTTARLIEEAAAALKELNPDVILLPQACDWQTCGQLVQALKPADYTVLLCSSFRDSRTGAPGKRQVAILSKRKAYFSWSEPWQAKEQPAFTGGFGFAAIQFGKQRVGFFAVQLDDGLSPAAGSAESSATTQAREAAARQWLQAVDSFKNWVTNRIGAVVVAGGFNDGLGGAQPGSQELAKGIKEAALADAFLGAPLDRPVTFPSPSKTSDAVGDHLLVIPLAANPENPPSVVLSYSPATCELDINPAKPTPGPMARTLGPGNHRRAEPNASTTTVQASNSPPQTPLQAANDSKSETQPAGPARTSEFKVPAPVPDLFATAKRYARWPTPLVDRHAPGICGVACYRLDAGQTATRAPTGPTRPAPRQRGNQHRRCLFLHRGD